MSTVVLLQLRVAGGLVVVHWTVKWKVLGSSSTTVKHGFFFFSGMH